MIKIQERIIGERIMYFYGVRLEDAARLLMKGIRYLWAAALSCVALGLWLMLGAAIAEVLVNNRILEYPELGSSLRSPVIGWVVMALLIPLLRPKVEAHSLPDYLFMIGAGVIWFSWLIFPALIVRRVFSWIWAAMRADYKEIVDYRKIERSHQKLQIASVASDVEMYIPYYNPDVDPEAF